MWEGRELEDGHRWQTDLNTVCTCTSGKVTCQADIKGKNDSASVCQISVKCFLSMFLSLSHTHKKHINLLMMYEH